MAYIVHHDSSLLNILRTVVLFIGCIIMIGIPGSAKAQKDTVNLKEVEVIGLKPEISTSSPNPVQLITNKQLASLPATSVAEAIRNFSGVTVKDFGGVGGLKTVMIRSLGANHTAVFVDGLPNHDAATGQIDLGRIALQDVGSITLSVGQPDFGLMTARMYASAGVLEIKTKEPDFKNKKNLVDLSLRAGSFATLNPSLGLYRKWSDKALTTVRINYYSSDGKFPYKVYNGSSVDEFTRQNSDVTSADILLRTSITFNDSSSIKIKASWYHSDRGLPGAIIYYNPFSAQRLNNDDIIAGIQYFTKSVKKSTMLVSAGLSHNQLWYKDPNFQNQSGGINNRYNQQEFYLSDAVRYNFNQHLSGSVVSDLIYNTLTTNSYSVESPDRLSSLTAGAIQWSAGNFELQASVLLTVIKDCKANYALNRETTTYSRIQPAISIIHTFTRDRSLKGRISFKQAMRNPSFNDLYYTLAGNVNLKPEDAILLDAGLLFSKAFSQMTGINFRIDAFSNRVSNKIVVLPTQNLFIWSTRNIGKADIKGIEVVGGIIKHLSQFWSIDVSGNYTYQEARDISNK
ncbi:MAG: TonB-dependent receptor plug domain-containing protein, partial [Chloroflexota bacterium]